MIQFNIYIYLPIYLSIYPIYQSIYLHTWHIQCPHLTSFFHQSTSLRRPHHGFWVGHLAVNCNPIPSLEFISLLDWCRHYSQWRGLDQCKSTLMEPHSFSRFGIICYDLQNVCLVYDEADIKLDTLKTESLCTNEQRVVLERDIPVPWNALNCSLWNFRMNMDSQRQDMQLPIPNHLSHLSRMFRLPHWNGVGCIACPPADEKWLGNTNDKYSPHFTKIIPNNKQHATLICSKKSKTTIYYLNIWKQTFRNFDPSQNHWNAAADKGGYSLTAIPSRKHWTSMLHMQTHSKVIWDQVHTSFTSTLPSSEETSLSLLEIFGEFI